MKLSEELTWRGFVNQTTYKDITVLDGDPVVFYWGVDPSADSMQVGNLAIAMMVRHFIEHGHKAILLVGGATGLIGDPDGKTQERELKSLEEIQHNKEAIKNQYAQLFAGKSFETVDNYDWFKDMGYLQFLRDVGKHVPMRQMLGREFVQTRLKEDGTGISYAEFSYSLIQGYDFLHLNREKGVTLQVCGADQWGNSIAGVELVRRINGQEAHIWSAPLVVNKTTGVKFGKSEDGAVWLDSRKTSPYQFYQFWLNTDDESAESLLKIYTLLSRDEIEEALANPSPRHAQTLLAYEVTKLIHGQQAADDIVKVSQLVVSKEPLQEDNYQLIENILGSKAVSRDFSLVTAIVELGLAKSNTEARQFLSSEAIFINNVRVTDENKTTLNDTDFHDGLVVMRRGKNTVAVGKLA